MELSHIESSILAISIWLCSRRTKGGDYMSKEQKIYSLVGQAVCKAFGILALNGAFLGMFALWLLGY